MNLNYNPWKIKFSSSSSSSLRSAADTRIVKTIPSGHRTLPVSVRHSTSLSSSSLFNVLSQFTFFLCCVLDVLVVIH